MEPAGKMTAPRVTKCGHMFCYACLLQYIDYDNQYAWKKCPLCADPVYKRDIRKASFVLEDDQKGITDSIQGTTSNELKFKLIVRNKSNIVAKHKVTTNAS